MTDFAKSKYHNDPQFKQLVDYMTSVIIGNDFTPSEMRSAAVLASINYEMYRFDIPRTSCQIDRETEEAFAILQNTWEKETGGSYGKK